MTRHDAKIDRLRGVYLFARCSERDLKKLASITDQVDYPAGHVLCAEGDVGHECFVLIDGQAEVRVGDRVVGTIGPGESVGEMGLLNRRPRSATVVAATPLSAYVISGRRFLPLLEDTPAVSLALLCELADRLRALDVAYATPAPA